MSPNENIARYAGLILSLDPELGRCSMELRDILTIAPGSVIRLSQPIGSKIDIRVGDALFGTGELIEMSGKLALRFAAFAKKEPGAPRRFRGN